MAADKEVRAVSSPDNPAARCSPDAASPPLPRPRNKQTPPECPCGRVGSVGWPCVSLAPPPSVCRDLLHQSITHHSHTTVTTATCISAANTIRNSHRHSTTCFTATAICITAATTIRNSHRYSTTSLPQPPTSPPPPPSQHHLYHLHSHRHNTNTLPPSHSLSSLCYYITNIISTYTPSPNHYRCTTSSITTPEHCHYICHHYQHLHHQSGAPSFTITSTTAPEPSSSASRI
ncbi:hypothetical protein E2C01_030309 [Portunus trituberculatus]|uniref:Uncharacterized protein n=1 Tax=Portunus trituberculatus TaxID=210409 RepID=A0A5B7EQI6_PORTR|nr:hypothetical protein [Portunus trituberculatus]